jgi:NADPH:quinone reductase-like Zn-dependent oxidoreductase
VGIEGSLHTVVDLVMRFLWPGFLGGGKRKLQMLTVKGSRKDLEGIGEWMSQGKVRAVQDQVLRMEDAPKAFERLKTHHARGKIVVTVGE